MGNTNNTPGDAGRLDLATLEKIYRCPVCLDLPVCKIYQCREGHLICKDCFDKEIFNYHGAECNLFEKAGKYKSEPVTTYKAAKGIYMYLTPLRCLLASEKMPEILELNGNLEERMDTLVYFLTISHVIKPIHKELELSERFSADQIQVNLKITTTIYHYMFHRY